MARTLINFRIDEELKSDLEEICEDMGMSLSTKNLLSLLKN